MENNKIIRKKTEQQRVAVLHKKNTLKSHEIRPSLMNAFKENVKKDDETKPFKISNGKIEVVTDDRNFKRETLKNGGKQTRQTTLDEFNVSKVTPIQNVNKEKVDEDLLKTSTNQEIQRGSDFFEETNSEKVPTFNIDTTQTAQTSNAQDDDLYFEQNSSIPNVQPATIDELFEQAPAQAPQVPVSESQNKDEDVSIVQDNIADTQQIPEETVEKDAEESKQEENKSSENKDTTVKPKAEGVWKGGLKDLTELFLNVGTPLIALGAIAAVLVAPIAFPVAVVLGVVAAVSVGVYVFRGTVLDFIDSIATRKRKKKDKTAKIERKKAKALAKEQKKSSKNQAKSNTKAKKMESYNNGKTLAKEQTENFDTKESESTMIDNLFNKVDAKLDGNQIKNEKLSNKEMSNNSSSLPKIEVGVKRNTKNIGLAYGEDGYTLDR